jgi:hypothetical protein
MNWNSEYVGGLGANHEEEFDRIFAVNVKGTPRGYDPFLGPR